MEKTIKCPICGQPYKFYSFSSADQSACPSCVSKAERNTIKDFRDFPRETQQEYFGKK